MSELVKRLRRRIIVDGCEMPGNDALHREAADRIEELEAEVLYDRAFIIATDEENKRLREQLLGVGSIHLEAQVKRLEADNSFLQAAAQRASNIEKHRDELLAEVEQLRKQRDRWINTCKTEHELVERLRAALQKIRDNKLCGDIEHIIAREALAAVEGEGDE